MTMDDQKPEELFENEDELPTEDVEAEEILGATTPDLGEGKAKNGKSKRTSKGAKTSAKRPSKPAEQVLDLGDDINSSPEDFRAAFDSAAEEFRAAFEAAESEDIKAAAALLMGGAGDEEVFEDPMEEEDVDGPELILESVPGNDQRDGLMRWDEALTLEGQVEAILFAAPKPMSVQEICEVLADENGDPADGAEIERVVQNLLKLYRERNGGFRLDHEKGVGFQFRTVPAAAPLMERMFSARQRPLSRAALETLSIIAYRQPVTRADIEAIRGVDAGSIIKNLLDRELISCVGRKEDSGRPMMFGTSPEFLRVFRINSLDDLPPLTAFQPAPETMAEAEDRLELGEEVDVDEFMDDPEADAPNLSEGLVETIGTGDFADISADFQVREQLELQGDEPTAAAEQPRAGARFDAKGFDDDERGQVDSDSEVAIPTGIGIAPGGGEDADGGEDLDQRQGRERARDQD